MRHVIGLIIGIALAPALLYAPNWADLHGVQAMRQVLSNAPTPLPVIGMMALLGIVVGLAMSARWLSPLAALVPGLALLAWNGIYIVDTQAAIDLVPSVATRTITGMLTAGVYALVGAALFIAALMPHHWRRAPAPDPLELSDSPIGPPPPFGLPGEDRPYPPSAQSSPLQPPNA